MRVILALQNIPTSSEETHKMFFGDRKLIIDTCCSCGFDPREDYEGHPDLIDEAKTLDIEDGEDNWMGIGYVENVAKEMFEKCFDGKTSLIREEMVVLIRGYHFDKRPSYQDYVQNDGGCNYINWNAYFEAEEAAAQEVVDAFLSEHAGESFILMDGEDIQYYDSSVIDDGFLERVPNLPIDNKTFH